MFGHQARSCAIRLLVTDTILDVLGFFRQISTKLNTLDSIRAALLGHISLALTVLHSQHLALIHTNGLLAGPKGHRRTVFLGRVLTATLAPAAEGSDRMLFLIFTG